MSNTVSIDEQLTRLEEEIRRLKIEFDIYFNGGAVKPPHDTKYRVESLVKRLYDARGMTFGQRFRYNSLVARFNVYKELWRRNIKEREEGGGPQREPVVVASATPAFESTVVRCADPYAEPEKVRELYDSLVHAKRQCGERLGDISLERFEKMIDGQMRQIKEKLKCEAVEFTVEVADGNVKFKAKPAK